MKFLILPLLALASLVTAIPAPQRGGNRHRPSAAAAAPAASSPAASSASSAVPAPASASSTKSSAVAPAASASGSAGSAGAGTGDAAGAGATTTTGGAAGTATAETAAAGTSAASGGDGHKVTVINNCGSVSVQWQHQGAGQKTFAAGSTTVTKPIIAAIMWLDGYNGFKCDGNAVNCAMVEFTLGDNGHNAINYSLLMAGLGNHVLRAPMFIELTAGTCSAKAGGPCTGMTVAECPNGYTGTDTDTGPPVDCAGTGVGATITFCP